MSSDAFQPKPVVRVEDLASLHIRDRSRILLASAVHAYQAKHGEKETFSLSASTILRLLAGVPKTAHMEYNYRAQLLITHSIRHALASPQSLPGWRIERDDDASSKRHLRIRLTRATSNPIASAA